MSYTSINKSHINNLVIKLKSFNSIIFTILKIKASPVLINKTRYCKTFNCGKALSCFSCVKHSTNTSLRRLSSSCHVSAASNILPTRHLDAYLPPLLIFNSIMLNMNRKFLIVNKSRQEGLTIFGNLSYYKYK